ncbi:MAG: hypothetical protein M5U19_10005 [Microthrixaceae bacterium]|nr:hypothetical protein [Microthrixaceae bacterium]
MSDDEVMDELPEDLNLAEFVGPYTFPNNNRRRIPAAMYMVIGVVAVGAYLAVGDGSALVNTGLAVSGAGLFLFGAYGMVAGWTLRVDEADALVAAATRVGFPVGLLRPSRYGTAGSPGRPGGSSSTRGRTRL